MPCGIVCPNHSHVCGINSVIGLCMISFNESFPRMWDQRLNFVYLRRMSRIIPTYVGSTKSTRIHALTISNHSHVCGINSRLSDSGTRTGESFPRMWDQQLGGDPCYCAHRIIPTYVGSTCLSSRGFNIVSNHSHVCGINTRSL